MTIDDIVNNVEKEAPVKEKMVDIYGGVTYSILIGVGLDYITGLDLKGIIASRIYSTTCV